MNTRVLALCLTATLLSACAETQFLIHTAKKVNQSDSSSSGGRYKVGNPYQISDTWYYPHVDYSYDETGIASWYGPNFDGKMTANGETYDMMALTAAHRTLPLPTWVEVTNLENGRVLKLRINDRGPYAKGRIIDISKHGAELLGFQTNGVAKVRVRVLGDESRQLAARLQGGASIEETGSPITVEKLPKSAVDTGTLAPPEGATAAEDPYAVEQVALTPPTQDTASEQSVVSSNAVQQVAPTSGTGIFIQAGAFSQFDNANRAKAILSNVGQVDISSILINGIDLFRVRMGPMMDLANADQLLDKVIASGYPDARIVVD